MVSYPPLLVRLMAYNITLILYYLHAIYLFFNKELIDCYADAKLVCTIIYPLQ